MRQILKHDCTAYNFSGALAGTGVAVLVVDIILTVFVLYAAFFSSLMVFMRSASARLITSFVVIHSLPNYPKQNAGVPILSGVNRLIVFILLNPPASKYRYSQYLPLLWV